MSPKAEVTPKFLWLVFFSGLFIMPTHSQRCFRLSKTTLENVRLLSSMIGSVLQCLRDTNAFEFPKETLSSTQPMKRHIKEAFYDMSIQTLNIFNKLTFNSTLGKKYLQELERGLFEQVERVKECLKEEETENEVKENEDEMECSEENEMECSEETVLQRGNMELRSYFNRIKTYLRKKKFSDCAWKIVGVEIRRCLFFFHGLTKLLERE